MCIRDRNLAERSSVTAVEIDRVSGRILKALYAPGGADVRICLLYTSDAADERSSVDLGGRRIIKKKKDMKLAVWTRRQSSE